MALRQELTLEHERDIHVCTVMPATIDTPFFQHAANHTGRQAKAMPPVYTPDRVARTIVHCAQRPRRERYVGNAGRLLGYQYRVAPRATEWLLAQAADKEHLYLDREQPSTSGNVFEPVAYGTEAEGGWNGRRKTAVRRTATLAALAAGTALGLAASRSGADGRGERYDEELVGPWRVA
jgi:hypothetical protein